jgi:hypothetical protein
MAADTPDRRAADRHPVAIEVSAWSLVQPTVRLLGRTVDLSESGALLRLPGLSEAAVRLELRLALPDAPLVVRGAVVHRRSLDLVGVVFEPLGPATTARLTSFLGGMG